MSLAIFNQKTNNTGGALIAKLTYDNSILLTLFKQINNDQNNKKNNFDYKNPIVIKLSDDEVGDFIRAIRTNGKSTFYHSFEGNIATGSLSYYKIEAQGEQKEKLGFGISVTKGETTIKVGLSVGAAERFMEYLKFNLNKVFEASFIEDITKDKEFRDKQKSSKLEKIKQLESKEPIIRDVEDF